MASETTTAPPRSRLIKTWRDAELVTCDWMRYWGCPDAACTGNGADMGIDVIATKALAQVKFEGRAVSRPTLQRFEGAAAIGGQRRRLFCSLSGYTVEAEAYAESVGMALFEFDYQGVPQPVNLNAIEVVYNLRTGDGDLGLPRH